MDHEFIINGSLVLVTLHFAVMGHVQPINSVFYKLPQISATFQQYPLLETNGGSISVQDFIHAVIPDNHHNMKVFDYIHGSELCNDHLLMSCDIVMLKEAIVQAVDVPYKGSKMSTQLIKYNSIPTHTDVGTFVSVLGNIVATLDKADDTLCFKGYLDAVTSIFGLFNNSGVLVIGDEVLDCHKFLVSPVTEGVVVNRVNMESIEEVNAAVNTSTKVVWVQTPSLFQLAVPSIKVISDIAHKNNALLLVDNSLLSPVLSRPLEHGADMVLHSDCKFSTRGSDALAFISIKGTTLREKLKRNPGVLFSRLDCEILLEGIKTLPLRVLKQQENAQKIAVFLSSHFLVTKVNYLGLSTHTGRDMHYSQADGGGSVLSFLTNSVDLSRHTFKATKLFAKSGIFGGIKSMILLPFDVPEESCMETFYERGAGRGLICLSVGIEDITDLIQDLDHALTSGPI